MNDQQQSSGCQWCDRIEAGDPDIGDVAIMRNKAGEVWFEHLDTNRKRLDRCPLGGTP